MSVPYKTIAAPNVVYRVSRSVDPCLLPSWENIRVAERGRYDDPLDEFRPLYAATTPVGALTEVLADLRPRVDRMLEIALIGDDEDRDDARHDLIATARAAMNARLAGRYVAEIEIAGDGAGFVDLGAGVSRSRIELELAVGRLKVGDFTGQDRTLSRRAARAIFEDGHPGLIAPSAEDAHALAVAIFETGRESNEFRTALKVCSVLPANSYRNAVAAAVRSLLQIDGFSPLIAPDLHPNEAAMLRRAILALADYPRQPPAWNSAVKWLSSKNEPGSLCVRERDRFFSKIYVESLKNVAIGFIQPG
jgi:hypothetical protein